MEISEDLFELTQKEESASKRMYGGKIIRCLVAPYHSYDQLENIIPYTPTTYLFPERKISFNGVKKLVSTIVSNPKIMEAKIITTNQNLIRDMVDGCVRILTEHGTIVRSEESTFAANLYYIQGYLLENPDHQKSENERTTAVKEIEKWIEIINDHVNNNKIMSKSDFNDLSEKINWVGDDIISRRLKDLLKGVEVGGGKDKNKDISSLEEELEIIKQRLIDDTKNS